MLVESWSQLAVSLHSIPAALSQIRGLNFGSGLQRSSSSLTFRSVSTGRVGSIALAYIFLALKVRLVPASFEDPEFKSSFNQSLSLYTKYQVAIHQDEPDICDKSEVLSFKHFSLYQQGCKEA